MAVRQPRDPRRPPPPLDRAGLERAALRYVERFATTRAKLTRYLADKVRARGWADADAPDPAAIAARFAALGYVDDAAFAEARAGALTRRGYGAARVRGALHAAGIAEADGAGAAAVVAAGRVAAALTLARRRRIGPYADQPADRAEQARQLAAMARAGHDFALARAIVAMPPGSDPESVLAPLGLDETPC